MKLDLESMILFQQIQWSLHNEIMENGTNRVIGLDLSQLTSP
jgi:hypothetical protein